MVNPPERNFSALTTDLYEVTMACGYRKAGVSDYEAAFHVTFRENPFGGQFTVACGQRPRLQLRRQHCRERHFAVDGLLDDIFYRRADF